MLLWFTIYGLFACMQIKLGPFAEQKVFYTLKHSNVLHNFFSCERAFRRSLDLCKFVVLFYLILWEKSLVYLTTKYKQFIKLAANKNADNN